MRIIYMGTPDFALPALQMLYDEGYEIPLVVTRPDKARDRGKKVSPSPVKALALDLGLPVAQPESLLRNEAFLEEVAALEPDLIVVAAYGKLLPPALLTLPRMGCVNIHGSLLPKYRGAAPIQLAIYNGDRESGVSLMYMAEGMDTGDIIASRSTPTEGKTGGDLHDELAILGAELLAVTLPDILSGRAPRVPQNDEEATYAHLITKQDGLINWLRSPREIECQVRAFQPWPGAFTYYNGEQMKVLAAEVVCQEAETEGVPGAIAKVSDRGLSVFAGQGLLRITRLQMPGKKGMEVSAFLRGNSIESGSILG